MLFKHAKQNVSVTIFTDNTNNGLHKVEFDDFCKEYSGLKIDIKKANNIFHDRYIILDNNTTDDTSLYKPLLAQLQNNQTLQLR